ncbi:DUF748 domain-containing protein [Candidatus Omnitrophota bacterium]
MKIRFLEKLFLISVAVILVLYACLWILINVQGSDLIAAELRKITNEKVVVGRVDFRPFLGVSIDGVSIGDSSAEEIGISLSFLHLIKGTIGFNAITIKDVEATVKRDKDGVRFSFIPIPPLEPETKPPQHSRTSQDAPASGAKKRMPRFFVKRITLDDITVNFEDQLKRETFKGSLYEIKATVINYSWPMRYTMYFDLSSDMKLGERLLEDNLYFKGYIDLVAKSMDAELLVKVLPYRKFSAYCPPYWKPDNLGIKYAYFSLDSTFKAVDNDLLIENNLHLTDYKFIDQEDGKSKVPLIQGMLALVDKDAQGHPMLYFQMKTTLDDPHLDLTYVEAQFKAKAKKLPAAIAAVALSGASGVSKDTVAKAVDVAGETVDKMLASPDTAKDILKEAGKTFKALFSFDEWPVEGQEEEAAPQE